MMIESEPYRNKNDPGRYKYSTGSVAIGINTGCPIIRAGRKL